MINNIVINATNIVINLHLQYKTSKYFSINFRMQTKDYCRGNAKHLTLHSALFFLFFEVRGVSSVSKKNNGL